MRAAKPVNFWRLRQYLSYRPGQTFGMRINICQRNWDRDIQTITTFGQAQLIRRVDGADSNYAAARGPITRLPKNGFPCLCTRRFLWFAVEIRKEEQTICKRGDDAAFLIDLVSPFPIILSNPHANGVMSGGRD